jgi:dTDP-4-dehydrorhamnose 3,5-epimerase
VIHPLDPQLNIDWGVTDPVLSARDGNAPSLANVKADGRLPDYRACLDFRSTLRA